MQRYFLHFYDADTPYLDEFGEECADLAGAREAAIRSAEEIIAFTTFDPPHADRRFEIADAQGQVLAIVRLIDLVKS